MEFPTALGCSGFPSFCSYSLTFPSQGSFTPSWKPVQIMVMNPDLTNPVSPPLPPACLCQCPTATRPYFCVWYCLMEVNSWSYAVPSFPRNLKRSKVSCTNQICPHCHNKIPWCFFNVVKKFEILFSLFSQENIPDFKQEGT